MRDINKKIIAKSILAIALILLLSTIAYAKPFTDAFRGGLLQINDFFANQQYKPYSQAIDFFFFSLLFIAVYLMGVRYAFKEVKRPERIIAILLGLMTAFLLVLGGFSVTILLPYIQWILYILLFILYWWLLKGIKNKFWRFVLALLLTLLTIALFQGLFDSLTVPDAQGFFSSLGKSFEGIQMPGTPGVPDYLQNLLSTTTPAPTGPATLPSTTTPTGTPPAEKGGIFGTGFSWWWVLLIPLIAGGIWRRKDIAGLFRRGEKPARQEPAIAPATTETTREETIDDLITEVTDAIKKKLAVLNKIKTIIKEKEKRRQTVQGFIDLYHKKIVDAAFYLDPEHQKYKDLMAEHAEVTEILKIERELEKDLLELMGIEDDLLGKGSLPLGNWQREKFSGRLIEVTSIKTQKEWYGKVFIWYWYIKRLREHIEREYNERLRVDKEIAPELAVPSGIPDFYGKIFAKLDESFTKLKGGDSLLAKIKNQIVKYYVWTKEEEKIETTIKLLSDAKQLEKWLAKGWATRWHDIKDKQGDKLVRVFERERKMFMGTNQEPGLFRNLLLQLMLLQHIRGLLNALKSERVSMTQLQDLYIDKRVNNNWVDATKDAKKQPGIQLDGIYVVHTRIQEGLGPFNVGCYVNGQRRNGIKTVAAKHDEVRFTFEGIEILSPGTYNITFVCISTAEKVYERKDMKSIRIYVSGGAPVTPSPQQPSQRAPRRRPARQIPTSLTIKINRPAPSIPPAPAIEHPHTYTPPIPEVQPAAQLAAPAVPGITPDVTAFLNDLYTELRSKSWGRVTSLLDFALNQNKLDQKILEVTQISFLRNLLGSLENNNFQRAGDILNSSNVRETFRQNSQILEELKRIVEEIRRESSGEEHLESAPPITPAPPQRSEGAQHGIKNGIIQLYNSGDFGTLRSKYNPIRFGVINAVELIRHPGTIPIFNEKTQAGSYWILKTSAESGYVVPRGGLIIGSSEIDAGGLTDAFEIRNYRKGFRYRGFILISPAMFVKSADRWIVQFKGDLELGAEEPEA